MQDASALLSAKRPSALLSGREFYFRGSAPWSLSAWFIAATGSACAITLTLLATGIAMSVLLIAVYSRPFAGDVSVGPGLLKTSYCQRSPSGKHPLECLQTEHGPKYQNRISAISRLSRMTIQSMRVDRAPHAYLLDQRDWNLGQMDDLHGD